MAVDFYQLGRSPIERVLPRLAERIVGDGRRLLIVSADDGQLAMLDDLLWRYAPESFLPHARAGTVNDASQPLLLSESTDAPNGARVIALVDGRWREEALAFDRALHFFDESAVDEARTAWRAVTAQGLPRNYWRQADGRWENAATGGADQSGKDRG